MSFLGERLQERYEESFKQVEIYSRELDDLEEALNALDPTIVPRYHNLYETRGGEYTL